MALIKAVFYALLDMPEWLLEKVFRRFGNIESDDVEKWGGRVCFGLVVATAAAVIYLAL